MIDLDMMPPDWKIAENHAKTTKPGTIQHLYHQDTLSNYCPCCLKPINKQEIPLNSNSKQLEFLGFGFPLYFIFLKYCIVLLLILIVTYSGMSLFWAVQKNSQFCAHRRLLASEQTECTSFMVLLSQISSTIKGQQELLRMLSFFSHFFTLLYIRDSIIKTMEYYDEKTTSLSDYSILVKNLPLEGKIQSKIQMLFNHIFLQKQVQQGKMKGKKVQNIKKVREIILLPELTDYYALVEKKKKLIQKKRRILINLERFQGQNEPTNNQNITGEIYLINSEIDENNKKIEETKEQIRTLYKEDNLQSQKAIVILDSQVLKKIVLDNSVKKEFGEKLRKYFVEEFDGQLTIEQAPEPNEIIWANIGCSRRERTIGNLLGWGLSLLTLVSVTVIFYFLVSLKTKNLINAIEHNKTMQTIHEDYHYTLAVIIVYISLIIIVMFNKFILGSAFHHLTLMEKHQNTSDEEFSFAIKYALGMFFTTALMTLAVEDITFHNYYSHEYGVIEEESIMFLINAFFVPLIWLINPEQLHILIQRKLHHGKNHFTQHQANRIMSDSSYKMGKRYAEIIKTMWFTFLYSTLIPVGAFASLIGLGVYYWVDKYNLLRRSSINQNISGKLAIKCVKLLDMTLILRSIGGLLFDYQLRGEINKYEIAFSFIGLVYLILPLNKILNFLHQEQFLLQQQSYQTVKNKFTETYTNLNPIFINNTFSQFNIPDKPFSMDYPRDSLDQLCISNHFNHQLAKQKSLLQQNSSKMALQIQDQFYLRQIKINSQEEVSIEQTSIMQEKFQSNKKRINRQQRNYSQSQKDKENRNNTNSNIKKSPIKKYSSGLKIQETKFKNIQQTTVLNIR